MFNFQEVTAPNGTTYQEATFQSTLMSVADNYLENVNGTKYKLCTIEFENAKGQTKKASAMIYEANLNHGMNVGESYLTTVRITGANQPPLITVSHLTQAARATFDDFGFETTTTQETVTSDRSNGDIF